MKLNVGPVESFIRIFVGVCLLYATLHAYVGEWGYFSVYILGTGLSRFSPMKAILGINGNTGEITANH
jgi:hypothetical protein